MDALVVFESLFGNGFVVARAVATALGSQLDVELHAVGHAPTKIDADLLVVGGPNHQFGLSTPESRREAAEQATGDVVPEGSGLREWLEEVRPGRQGVAAAVYDTRMDHPRFLHRVDRTSRILEKRLEASGFRLVSPPQHFYVADLTGPLLDGERERAFHWGRELAAVMIPAPTHRSH